MFFKRFYFLVVLHPLYLFPLPHLWNSLSLTMWRDLLAILLLGMTVPRSLTLWKMSTCGYLFSSAIRGRFSDDSWPWHWPWEYQTSIRSHFTSMFYVPLVEQCLFFSVIRLSGLRFWARQAALVRLSQPFVKSDIGWLFPWALNHHCTIVFCMQDTIVYQGFLDISTFLCYHSEYFKVERTLVPWEKVSG